MVKAHWLRNHSSLPPLLVLSLHHPFLSFLPPSLHLSVHPPPLLPSLVSYSLATSFPDQLCFANSSAIHYARPAGVTLNTHRDPKQVPHTQNTHTQTHSIGSGSSRGITLNCRGKICRECGQKGCSSVLLPEKHCRRNNMERWKEEQKYIEKTTM